MDIGLIIGLGTLYNFIGLATMIYCAYLTGKPASLIQRWTQGMGDFGESLVLILIFLLWPIWWAIELAWYVSGFIVAYILVPTVAAVVGLSSMAIQRIRDR